MAEDRGVDARHPSRVGRVIRRIRPGILTLDGDLVDLDGSVVDADTKLPWLGCAARQKAVDIVRQWSGAIGRIDVMQKDGSWLPVGSCWVTSAGGNGANARIITAGHLLCAMTKPGNSFARGRVRTAFDAAPMRETRVTLADNPEDNPGDLRVTAVIWAHWYWDLVICELDAELPGLAVPPLAGAQDKPSTEMAVFGYPMTQGTIDPALDDSGFAQIFEGDLKTRRLSPGLFVDTETSGINVDSDVAAAAVSLCHDASTLAGSSGSPVFCLQSGNIVGLHFRGGGYYNDDNPGVPTPARYANLTVPLMRAMMAEPLLAIEMQGGPMPAGMAVKENFKGLWKASNLNKLDESESIFVTNAPKELPADLLRAVAPDRPDNRDYFYTPPLSAPRDKIPRDRDMTVFDRAKILNQGADPACVGFALAALINLQRRLADQKALLVSPRMLYEMALNHDEWLDEAVGGTSLRAAIKGFVYSGVCSDDEAPYFAPQTDWRLNRTIAEDAKKVMPGTYYRLRHNLVDFQAAIQEAGGIIISAYIHDGWFASGENRIRTIQLRQSSLADRAAHAFIAVGYDETGFIIQNSWGKNWGNWGKRAGFARWTYDDWAQNVIDAWVLRLAPSTPKTFGLQPVLSQGEDLSMPKPLRRLPRPHRFALLGHIVHVERDEVVVRGRLGLGLAPLREAAELLRAKELGDIRHILLIYHDPFLGADAITRIAAFQTETFLQNGIFPLHIAYGVDEVATISSRMLYEAGIVQDRFGASLSEASGYLERRAGRLCGRLVRDYGDGVAQASAPGGPLWQARAALCLETAKDLQVSALSFGAGSIAALTQARLSRAARNPALNRLLLVGGIGARPTEAELGPTRVHEWQLPSAVEIGAVPAYAGDWNDLVQAVQGGESRPRVDATAVSELPGTIAACCVDPVLLNAVIKAVKGRAPSAQSCFRTV
ncbi:trypsin-like peptidase domain-containing protein [Paracoccus xiamenensis]|uniref:trypsin-like peptidase domain-containing protein n=1 Tax=Paracoccus xiamenensis TaxID=2714901 RepID=UPI00140D5D72|nr:trypsin-like peptidase domain-containing protein [Paracoccus xiamenensis]NHF72005.1 hypothetical protein [Paracoccus xiamenensis]